jgi:hypothetical protein
MTNNDNYGNDKYENDEGVFFDVHTDKNGRDHISIYDKDPKDEDHSSIHINYDSDTGKGSITDTTSGSKDTTDTQCFLTTACMRHFQKNFDNQCEELTTLRKFRDSYVSKEDIDHYYRTAPAIVSAINGIKDNDSIYNYIYNNVVKTCVDAIKKGDYDFAYNRYKSSVLALENQFIKSKPEKVSTKVLKFKKI